ncbi:hypothetical protein HDU99_001627 [Rhizoclosmatium hyalinum]|nr:hypothetical protein HDU99_001627 [Rhizoclosmatium hyalinum]
MTKFKMTRALRKLKTKPAISRAFVFVSLQKITKITIISEKRLMDQDSTDTLYEEVPAPKVHTKSRADEIEMAGMDFLEKDDVTFISILVATSLHFPVPPLKSESDAYWPTAEEVFGKRVASWFDDKVVMDYEALPRLLAAHAKKQELANPLPILKPVSVKPSSPPNTKQAKRKAKKHHRRK